MYDFGIRTPGVFCYAKILQGLIDLANSKQELETRVEPKSKLNNNGLTATRVGSDSGRPLRIYDLEKPIVFKSDYAKIDSKIQCKFPYDLGDFVEKSGGGWHNYAKAGTNADMQEKAYVPYKKQEEFARFWWDKYDRKFHDMGWVWKEGFVFEAILDSTNLFNVWYRREPGVFPPLGNSAAPSASNYMGWQHIVMEKLAAKK